LIGDLAPTEAAFALKQLIEGQGGRVECRTDGAALPEGNRGAYVGTAKIEDIDSAKRIILIGTNPRLEAPVLNARIRKAWLKGAKVELIGEATDLTYDYAHLGTDRTDVTALAASAKSAETPALVIVGQGALTGKDGAATLSQALKIATATEARVLVLHTAASRVGAMDVDATASGVDALLKASEVIYNLGADEVDIPAGAFVIYQGSHGDRGAHRADIILPAAAWTEENGLFVNTEGRPQLAMRASFPPGEAKENWAILRALSAELGAKQPWDSLNALRQALFQKHPHLMRIGEVAMNDWLGVSERAPAKGAMRSPVTDYYLTNPIARASAIMAECSAQAQAQASGKLAAE
jgi:NADH-quinone oxidoreductase subunit G